MAATETAESGSPENKVNRADGDANYPLKVLYCGGNLNKSDSYYRGGWWFWLEPALGLLSMWSSSMSSLAGFFFLTPNFEQEAREREKNMPVDESVSLNCPCVWIRVCIVPCNRQISHPGAFRCLVLLGRVISDMQMMGLYSLLKITRFYVQYSSIFIRSLFTEINPLFLSKRLTYFSPVSLSVCSLPIEVGPHTCALLLLLLCSDFLGGFSWHSLGVKKKKPYYGSTHCNGTIRSFLSFFFKSVVLRVHAGACQMQTVAWEKLSWLVC